ncbi:OLC1v1000747C1 [Oldenlandia corymbosa var. corymbosa]|uniref:OLC1v1000747C1 n=1 Tax=Oldenlandia corymbosa var. corymbosa TaxID=529605 RepID=A0AAV1D4I1_OLDCO|nr:OLC1v1000747C1 [Oldenlandia corymbosa var. corymbosa]
MASTLIAGIRSALHHVDLLVETNRSNTDDFIAFKFFRFFLRNLKMYLLSAGKLGKDASPGSSFVKIEGIAQRFAEFIHSIPVGLDGQTLSHISTENLKEDLDYFSGQANEMYVNLMELKTTQQSSSFTVDEVLEIMSSSAENLVEFHTMGRSRKSLVDAVKALVKQMTFLKNLLLFTTQSKIEPTEGLLAHAEVVAINAAYLLSLTLDAKRVIQFSTLAEKIKPIDPQVCKTYTDALCSSKLEKILLAPADQDADVESCLLAANNLLSSLVSVVWEAPSSSTRVVVPMKDQLQELYEGLGFLSKAILKQLQQPNKFDPKIKEQIGAVVCGAGILIFSFHQTNVQLDLGLLHDLLEAIKILLAELGRNDPQVSKFTFHSTTQLTFVDFVLERLMELTSRDGKQTANSWVQTIQEELVSLRSFLGDTVELRHQQKELQAIWDRILEVTYKLEDVVDNLMVGDLQDVLSASFESIKKDISDIKLEIEVERPKIEFKRQENEVKEVPMTRNQVESITLSMTKEVVGFHDEANSIINRLKRGSKKLRIVPIVGMPGLGKTTLAEKVYNDPSVLCHFSVRAFTTVSQTVDKKRVLLDLLRQVAPDKYSKITSEANADDVAEQLRRSLKGRPYLIVLDDVWEGKAWESLQQSFPDDSVGSRIILTSRRHDVADAPHELRQLNKEESMDLLKRHLFSGNGWPIELHDLGMKIAEICNGLPLTVIIVAGVLKSKQPQEWKKILDKLSLGDLSERCRDTLELSYTNLPEHLKPCLLYLASFQEDQQISVRRLLQLWMAEGFVRKSGMKRLSDVAEEYLKDLIGRSLLIVEKQKSNGGVRACRIHDLLHEFCLQKAKDEQFFHFLEGRHEELSTFSVPRYRRKLCIDSSTEHFIEWKVYCSHIRSLRFKKFESEETVMRNLLFLMHISKLLRVLDLEQICLDNMIPDEIGLLVHLAYLGIRGNISDIPPSIGSLSNLETFILNTDQQREVSLPDTFWNLQKLQHFYMTSKRQSWAILPMKNLDSSPDLYELDRMSGVIIPCDGSIKGIMRKFPNIRKLSCRLRKFDIQGRNLVETVVLDFLHKLESLHIIVFNYDLPRGVKFEFCLPENLKKLTLSHFRLDGRSLSSIGKLKNLEVLKLDFVTFEGNTWTLEEEEEFSRLRILKLYFLNLRSWSASGDLFGCLEKLELYHCSELEEVPSCLENILTLKMIEVNACRKTVVELVKNIAAVQVELGNTEMKIIIREPRN